MRNTNFQLRFKSNPKAIVWLTASLVMFLAIGMFGWRQVAKPTIKANFNSLKGEAAVEALKKDGSYDSLAKAVAATKYQITKQGDRFQAENPTQQFNASFSGKELRITQTISGQPSHQFGLRLLGYGYGENLSEVGEGERIANGDRIEIRKSAITEWYVNKPEGLEQGFTIHERPQSSAGNSESALRLDLEVMGDLQAELAEDSQTVVLKNRSGQLVLSYDKLAAWDADGKQLAAKMNVRDKVIALEVDDRDARYPLTIDPLISQQQKLLASDGAANDAFGSSVAINEAGDLALVGAYGDASNKGAAYVFHKTNGVWSQEAKLTYGAGNPDDEFGWAVAISYNTAVIGMPGLLSDKGAVAVYTRSNGVWSFEGTLVGSDSAAGDRFGASVSANAIGANNATVVVGALQDDDAAGANQGSAYVFVRTSGLWTQQQKLVAGDAAASDQFGRAVSISGDTAVVTAQEDDVSGIADKGSAYVFVRNGAFWTQQAKLTANDGAASDRFGKAASISGNTVIVTTMNDDIGGNNDQGAAYVFTRSGATWSQQAKLTAADGAANDYFGTSVDVKGEIAVVGAYFDDDNFIGDRGSAYVFARNSGTWSQQQKLSAADATAGDQFGNSVAISNNTVVSGAWQSGSTNRGAAYAFMVGNDIEQQQKFNTLIPASGEYFGTSLAVDGNTAVVGSYGWSNFRGAAYVFTRTAANTWIQTHILTASNGDGGGGQSGDYFGVGVAIDGDTIVVGAHADDFAGNNDRGSIYVFVRNGNSWSEEVNFSPADGQAGDHLGYSVAIRGNTILAGAFGSDIVFADQGAAYVFVRDVLGNWIQQKKLFSPDGVGEEFGSSVALEGDTALIGAPNNSSNKGAAYVFSQSSGNWIQQQKLLASDGATGDQFGYAVALSGNTALIGAPWDNNNATDQGSAYVFVRDGATWSQQQKLTDPGGTTDDRFGSAVAVKGDQAIVSAEYDNNQGSAHIYRREAGTWTRLKKQFAADGLADDYFGSSVAVTDWGYLVGAYFDDVSGVNNRGSVYYYVFQECPQMTLSALSGATVGTAYNQTVTVAGGTGPFQFSLAEGSLPPGLTLSQSGTVSGTPSQAGAYNFSIQAMMDNLCTGIRHYTISVVNNACANIVISPGTLPGAPLGAAYSQTMTASGGAAPYSYSYTGSLPTGVSLNQQTGQLSGQLNAVGTFNFTIIATDVNGCADSNNYSITVTNGGGVSANNLQFYPLAHPVRLLDTRVGATGCDAPGAKIAGNTSRHQTAAGRTCDGLTIPANAAALMGNVTTVQSGGGYLTLYPSDIAKPLAANSNFAANQILNNVFTVRLGAGDGAFKIFVSSNTDVVVDITGYYAPPGAGGLYFHPLPKPVRLLDTRAGASGCFTPDQILQANATMTQLGQTTCDGVLIPAGAQALVGNATTTNQQAKGYMTLYPANAAQPLAASSNFQAGINMNAPFMVGLSPSGQFNIFTASTTDIVIDVLGYYSTQLNDSNGQGLLFNALAAPVRLLDTRAGLTACSTPNAQMVGGTAYQQPATTACTGIPAAAQSVVGNATTLNAAANGYLTLWPSDASQPFVATSNYRTNQVFNRHFTVGLGADGAFKRFAASTTDLVVDLVGYFAP